MAFTREDTIQKVVSIIATKLSIPEGTITLESTFKDLGLDSLDTVEVIMTFEEVFGIQIQDEETEKIASVKHAVDLVHASRVK